MTLSVVTWKWHTPGYRSVFTAETVNTLRRMVARHYTYPHRFLCVTDDAAGLSPDIEVVPAWNDYANVPSPAGGKHPSCYRRLRAFHPEIGEVFGPRFVSIDLDVVITGDLQGLWQRPEDFVIWGDTNPRTYYNGSMILMNAGARPRVWTDFDPRLSPRVSRSAGHFGSDQGWISHCLGPKEAKWARADGIVSFRNDVQPRGYNAGLPSGTKLVVFHGAMDPWSPIAQRNYGWIREHYK
jgi:hypothetical protein